MIKLNHVCNGNPTGSCQPFVFWHDQNLCVVFLSYTLCRILKFPKNIRDMDFTSNESLLLFLLQRR